MGRVVVILTANLTAGAGAEKITMLCPMTTRNLRAGDIGAIEKLGLLLSLSAAAACLNEHCLDVDLLGSGNMPFSVTLHASVLLGLHANACL